jgi:hypothetical protein
MILRARWTVVFGVVGVLGIIVATACALTVDVLASAAEVAPLAALTGRRRWLVVLAAWCATLPLVVAGLAGAGAYVVLPSGLAVGEFSMAPSTALAVSSVLFSCAIGVVVALATMGAIGRMGTSWRPGLDQ